MIYHCLLTTVYCLLSAVVDLNPPEMQVLIQSGLEFAYVEEFDSALIYFDEIIQLYPENPPDIFLKPHSCN